MRQIFYILIMIMFCIYTYKNHSFLIVLYEINAQWAGYICSSTCSISKAGHYWWYFFSQIWYWWSILQIFRQVWFWSYWPYIYTTIKASYCKFFQELVFFQFIIFTNHTTHISVLKRPWHRNNVLDSHDKSLGSRPAGSSQVDF